MRTPPPIHLGRLGLGQVRTIAGCVIRVLADSERTEDIVTAEEIASQRQLQHLIGEGIFLEGEGERLWEKQADMADVDVEALSNMPASTLGGAFARFLSDNGLSTKLYDVGTPHTDDRACAYLLRRIRQSHDVWHVLMGFSTAGHDEILLHGFSLAQTGFPSSVALLALGSLKHMLLEARFACLSHGMREAYRRGRQADSMLTVHWEEHWAEPLDRVRARYHIRPWTAEDSEACEPWKFDTHLRRQRS